jgi:predicted nucleotidyltransferase/uncharacterized protein (UPF0332 family)
MTDGLSLKEERLKVVRKFGEKVLEKYGKYVKAIVMMGSVAREEFKPTSDIDVFVILDDTTGELTPELQDKIDEDIEKIAEEIPEAVITIKDPITGQENKVSLISVQPSYTLTEFTDYARVGHPIIYNFIKEGIPIFDTGFFTPWKNLLLSGRISGTREAIESYMEGAPKKLMRAKTVKLLMLAEDCFYAILNTAQAVLMFMGLPPPVPSKAYDDVMKYLVEPGILEKQYADWLKEIVEIRKKIEHKELTDVSGAFVDEWISRSEKFIEKMFSLLNALEIRKREKILERTHEVMIKAAITALKTLHKIKLPKELDEAYTPDVDFSKLVKEIESRIGMPIDQAFKRDFIDTKRVNENYWNIWNKIENMRKLANEKKFDKVSDKDVYEMREYVRKLIRDLAKTLKREETEDNE